MDIGAPLTGRRLMKQRFFLCYAILLPALLFNACEEPPQKAPLEPGPAFVMPTSPRIIIEARSSRIEIIRGSHADYGTIVWTPAYTENGRVDVYFRADNSVVSP